MWYTSPERVAPYAIAPADFGDAGTKLAGLATGLMRANVLNNTQMTPAETAEQYQQRMSQWMTANPQRASETPEQYQDRIKGAVQAPAPVSNDPGMSREPGNLFKPETSVASDGTYTQTQPGMFDAGQKSFESIGVNAPKPQMTMDMRHEGETPEEYKARAASAVGAKREGTSLSDYYNTLSQKLAFLDPQKSLEFKNEAVKQRAIETYNKANPDLSPADRVVGMGMTVAPFDAPAGTQMMVAGSNLQMTQQNRAKEQMGNVAAEARALHPDDPDFAAKYTALRNKWTMGNSNSPFNTYIPKEPTRDNLNAILTAGGLEKYTTPPVESLEYGNKLLGQATAMRERLANQQASDPTDLMGLQAGMRKDWLTKQNEYAGWMKQYGSGNGSHTVVAPDAKGEAVASPDSGAKSNGSFDPEAYGMGADVLVKDDGTVNIKAYKSVVDKIRKEKNVDVKRAAQASLEELKNGFPGLKDVATSNAEVKGKKAGARSEEVAADVAETQKKTDSANESFAGASSPYAFTAAKHKVINGLMPEFSKMFSSDPNTASLARNTVKANLEAIAKFGGGSSVGERAGLDERGWITRIANNIEKIAGNNSVSDAEALNFIRMANTNIESINNDLSKAKQNKAYASITYDPLRLVEVPGAAAPTKPAKKDNFMGMKIDTTSASGLK